MCTTASPLCRLVFYFHIGAIFSGLSLRWCLRASSSYYFHHKNVCVCRALKRKTIFMCFLTSIARSFFSSSSSWPKERSFLLSSCYDRSECVWRKIFCKKKTSTLCRSRCCCCWHYICRILCVKKEGKATMTTETENPRIRLLAIGWCLSVVGSACVYIYIWLGSGVLEREVWWRRRSTTIGDFNMKHFSNS